MLQNTYLHLPFLMVECTIFSSVPAPKLGAHVALEVFKVSNEPVSPELTHFPCQACDKLSAFHNNLLKCCSASPNQKTTPCLKQLESFPCLPAKSLMPGLKF